MLERQSSSDMIRCKQGSIDSWYMVKKLSASSREMIPSAIKSGVLLSCALRSMKSRFVTEDPGNEPRRQARLIATSVTFSVFLGEDGDTATEHSVGILGVAGSAPGVGEGRLPCRNTSSERTCSILFSLCSISSFQLRNNQNKLHCQNERNEKYWTDSASLSNNVCRLLFTVHESPRALHRVHGGLDPSMWHFILILSIF